jgi:AAA ATPase domain
MTAPVWLLLTAGAVRGLARPLTVRVGAGVHGQAVRRVDVAGGDSELRHAATRAATETARILYRERHLDREIVVNFAIGANEPIGHVIGRSAELAFAVALAGAAVARALPAVAATGLVEQGGAIRPVDGLAEKLAAALEVLPRGGVFAFPAAGEQGLPDQLRAAAAARGVTLMPAYRLEDLLAQLGVVITRTWLSEPFRGLEPFGFAHASIFFGRDTEIAEIVALLSRRPAILVRGPSGTGKSSVVLAGVVPALLRRADGEQVRWGLLRPRDIAAQPDARDALARALRLAWAHDEQGGLGAGLGDGLEAAAAGSAGGALDADAFVVRLRAHGARRPVLVIDQLEELFEPRLPVATVDALAAFLAEISRRGVALLATITSAAMPEFAALAPLAACFGVEGQYVLEPRHDPTLLEAVIGAPAAAAGLRFETGLQAELVAAASHGGADVLPLLELLLTELYDRRDPATRELRLADYRAVGGLDGVISARAEDVYARLSPDQQAAVALLLWKLATAGAVETPDFPAGHPIHGVLAAYQKRRLLVRDHADGEGATLRAAHEALLRHWSRAVAQRRADDADIERWLDLVREARQRGRGERALIPSGPQLEAARGLLQRRRPFLTQGDAAVVDYVKQSLHQRQRRAVLAGLAVGVPLVAGLGWGGEFAFRRWRAQFETHITFDDVEIGGKDREIPAEDYLLPLGIRISARTPAESSIVIIRSLDFYGGRAASGVAGQHFLTQQVSDKTVPNDFTLTFERPPRRIGLLRAKLWAATGSGVSHPAWRAEALGADGGQLDAVSEDLLRAIPDPARAHRLLLLDRQSRVIGSAGDFVPEQLFVVRTSGAAQGIPSLRITSDYRLDGEPFAGSRSVLINELILFYA